MPPLSEALSPFAAVIVTGGSSGIGKSFIRLAGTVAGHALICNLSRRDPGEKIFPNAAGRLNHFSCDLAQPAQLGRVADDVCDLIERAAPPGPVLLINNAGLGAFGEFASGEAARELAMVDINVRAVVQLTARLLPLLLVRGGTILNVASTVAFQPTPYAATYGATKAFVLHWSIALDRELRGRGVRAIAVCPGTTDTDFFRAAGAPGAGRKALRMTADDVAAAALRALSTRRSHVVTGWFNRAYALVGSKLPKRVAAGLAARVFRRFRHGSPDA